MKDTKTGLRNAAQGTVAVDDDLTLETLRALIDIKTQQSLDRVLIWSFGRNRPKPSEMNLPITARSFAWKPQVQAI